MSNFRPKCTPTTVYLIASILLAIFMVFVWFGDHYPFDYTKDIWEHTADVKELSKGFVSPKHPFFITDAKTVRYTPYTVMGALLITILGIDTFTAYYLLSTFNLLLFLSGFFLFVRTRFNDEKMPIYSLLTLIFFWGADYVHASDFHLNSIIYGSGNPSFFVFGLSLWALYLIERTLKGRLMYLPLILILTTIILVSHPLTFVFYITSAFWAITLNIESKKRIRMIVASIILCGALLSLLNPYYSPLELLVFSLNNKSIGGNPTPEGPNLNPAFYFSPNNILGLGLGVVLGFVVTMTRIRDSRYGPIAFNFMTFFLIYLIPQTGLLFIPLWHRMLFFWSFYLLIGLAAYLSEIGLFNPYEWYGKLSRGVPLKEVLVMVLFLYYTLTQLFFTAIVLTSQRDMNPAEFRFLEYSVGPYDTILSDLRTSYVTPTFNGKVVGCHDCSYTFFRNNNRNMDVYKFFDNGTQIQARWDIIRKYNVSYILTNGKFTTESITGESLKFGDLVYDKNNFTLIKVTHGSSK